jgi:hypothetical protein
MTRGFPLLELGACPSAPMRSPTEKNSALPLRKILCKSGEFRIGSGAQFI